MESDRTGDDCSDPATDWQGLHEIKDTITLFNPASGYILNTNNWPFAASGVTTLNVSCFAGTQDERIATLRTVAEALDKSGTGS